MAATLDLGNLLVHLRFDTTQYMMMMKSAEQRMKLMSQRMTAIGTKMMMRVTVPLAIIGGLGVKAMMDLESAFTGVRKTVDATEAELDRLRKGFEKMSTVTPIALKDLYGIGEAAGQLGIQTKNILGFSKVMAELGVTTNIAAQEAAMQLARFANITQMSQGDFDRLGATIVDLGNNLATTEAEIVTMGLRMAGAAKVVGLTDDAIMSLAAAVSSVGIQAEAGGSAMSRVMLNMSTYVKRGGVELKGLAKVAGVTTEEFARSFKENAAVALHSFVEGLDGLRKKGTDVAGVLETFGWQGIRIMRVMLGLAGASDILKKSLEIGSNAWEENIALTREAELRYSTFASQMTVLKNKLVLMSRDIGQILKPILLKLKEYIEKMIIAWNGLSDSTKKFIVIVGLLAAALGPALIIIGTLIKLIAILGVAALSTAGSLLLIVAALVAIKKAPEIGKYLYDEFKIVQQVASQLVINLWKGWEYVKYGFKQMVAGMRMAWDTFASFLVESFAGTIRKIAEGFGALENMINNLPWVENVSLGAEKIEAWAKSLEDFAKTTGKTGKEMWEQNKVDLEQQLAFLDELGMEVFKDIEANFAKVEEEAVTATEEIIEATKTATEAMGDVIDDVGWKWHELFEDWAGSALDTFGNLKQIASDAMDGVSESLTDMVMTGKANFNELANSILRDITRMIIRAQLARALMAFMPGLMPVMPGAAPGPIPVPVGHAGGIVGKMGPGRFVPATVFANAPRFHDGLASDEVPTILQKGEMVLSKNDVSQLGKGSEGGGRGSSVNITVQAIDAQGTFQFLEKNKRTIASMLQGTMMSNHPIRRFDR